MATIEIRKLDKIETTLDLGHPLAGAEHAVGLAVSVVNVRTVTRSPRA